MTSVQSAPAVPQGGGTIPPGIKPQDVRNMYAVSRPPPKPGASDLRAVIVSSHLVAQHRPLDFRANSRCRHVEISADEAAGRP